MKLRGKTALVTGASKGIGRAIAEAFAGEGARLLLNARGEEALRATAGELRGKGAEVETLAGDVGEEEVAGRLVKAAVDRWGRLDVLVNNAGVGHRGPFDEMDVATFDELYRTNVRGPFLLMRAAAAQMKRQGGGSIVNVASLAGVNPVPGQAVYASTKWALIGLSRSVFGELRKHNVRMLIVEPGSTLTDFAGGEEKRKHADKIPHPEDVAQVVVAALALPERACISEIEIRPTNPP